MGGSDSENLEPNLTPMLDLVLQILMFFIATTQMSAEPVDQETTLPYADFAKPTTLRTEESFYMNLRYGSRKINGQDKVVHFLTFIHPSTGKDMVLYLDNDPLLDQKVARVELENAFRDMKRNLGEKT